jgi:hypothetical protein
MAFNKVLIALTFAVGFPVAALAQAPAWSIAATTDCCASATDDGTALARSVLLPAEMTMPVDKRASALAASVLLPEASAGCCDHAAHQSVPTAAHAGHTAPPMAGMGCCNHDAKTAAAKPETACCQDMKDDGCCKDGCDMPCCQSVPPTR